MTSDALPDFRTTVDILVTWTGAVTMLRYAHTLSRSRASTLEVRTLFLVLVLSATLLARGFLWLQPGSAALSIAVGIPASFLPFAATLFVEGLLRRHVPGPMKLFAIGAENNSTTIFPLPIDMLSGFVRKMGDVLAPPAAEPGTLPAASERSLARGSSAAQALPSRAESPERSMIDEIGP